MGNDNWLVDVAKDFRFNTTTNNMVPLVIDLVSKASVYASPTLGSNEIKPIAVATVIKSNAGFTNLLVAKSLGATFQKLNINELNAFRNYITQYKQFTGTNIQVSSQDSDVMAYNLQIRFDFTKGTPNPELTIKTAIETACRNIGFNGKLERLVLEDAIQKVPGVLGIVGDYKAKDFTASEFIFFQDYYQTVSGYINLSTNNADLIMVLTPNE
ncbi:MAG: hypothetical protein EAZ27_04470 [Cytophagales bacterium]|nr:MAG: hypothetical protein EAZ27_04470 [Cytophagales bacterium]